MTKTARRAVLYFGLVLAFAAGIAAVANAQQPAKCCGQIPANTIDALKAIDQLTEQNRQLEKQNQQLMEQIAILRRTLAAQHPPAPQSAEPAVRSAGSGPEHRHGTDHRPGIFIH